MIRMQLTKCRRVIGKDEIATELRNGYEKSTSLRPPDSASRPQLSRSGVPARSADDH